MPPSDLQHRFRLLAVAVVERHRHAGVVRIDEPEGDLVRRGRHVERSQLRKLADRPPGGHEAVEADHGELVVAEIDDAAEHLDKVAGRQRRSGREDEVAGVKLGREELGTVVA